MNKKFIARTKGGEEYKLNYIKEINWEKCTGCGNCSNICGANVLKMVNTPQGFKANVISPDKCLGEGHCLKGCHAEALIFEKNEI